MDPTWAKCPTTINPSAIYARLNKKLYDPKSTESGVDFVRINLNSDGKGTWWHHHDEDVDAAAIPVRVDNSVFDAGSLFVRDFAIEEETKIRNIGDTILSAWSLIRQAAELPDEAQAELVQSLVEMRSQHLGIYHLDDEERAALARSGEDMRLGRFASDKEVEETFARYGA